MRYCIEKEKRTASGVVAWRIIVLSPTRSSTGHFDRAAAPFRQQLKGKATYDGGLELHCRHFIITRLNNHSTTTLDRPSQRKHYPDQHRTPSIMPATTAETLSIVNRTVTVAPLVLLSVADHYGRSAKGTKKRVLGVLLGQNDGKSVRVSNSFASAYTLGDNARRRILTIVSSI